LRLAPAAENFIVAAALINPHLCCVCGSRQEFSMIVRGLISTLMFLCVAAPSSAQQTKAPSPAEKSRVKVETVARGLSHPWALQFLPDGRMLVTERPGRLRIIAKDGSLSEPVAGVPPVFAVGQGGLLDVALDPDFAKADSPQAGRIYLTYAESRGVGLAATAIMSAKLSFAGAGARLDQAQVIFRQQPAMSGSNHFGGRIAIARDGNLFVTMGERFQRDRAQEVDNHLGKVIRIASDGKVPNDNPARPGRGAMPEIWSHGHRNPQAAAINPESGKLWVVEHGARGGDEINVPEAGKNYGWPVITYGIDYSGAKIGVGQRKDGMEQPIYYWDPSIAPSGMAFYTGDLMPSWKGNLFVGALAGQHLTRLILKGEAVIGEERLLADLGERIRDVRQGLDGALYVATDHPEGRILRLTQER
jgi:glucose/arabinose dehydrogenase